MRVLIVEDEFTSRMVLQEILSPYGSCHIAINGEEATQAFVLAWGKNEPYDLICMDIMMPNIDGHQALKNIRGIEKEMGVTGSEEVKVIMITALDDPKNVVEAFHKGGATSYIIKPVNKRELLDEVRSLGLLNKEEG